MISFGEYVFRNTGSTIIFVLWCALAMYAICYYINRYRTNRKIELIDKKIKLLKLEKRIDAIEQNI